MHQKITDSQTKYFTLDISVLYIHFTKLSFNRIKLKKEANIKLLENEISIRNFSRNTEIIESGYKVKYGLSPWKFPRVAPSRNFLPLRPYFTIYPSSPSDTDTVLGQIYWANTRKYSPNRQ